MSKIYFSTLWFVLLISINLNSFAQTIAGYIRTQKGDPIESATIIATPFNKQIKSNSNGFFEFVINTDKATLEISALGYQTLQKVVLKNQIDTLNIVLKEDNLNLNEVVVSATRNGINRQKAPVVVNVVGPKIFNATQSVAMSETLNYQPGVRVENNCQNCGFSQVRLNGLEGAYSQILINSRAVYSALNSVYGLDQIPTSMIDRIEVVRSGGSALFGANAIAGTINIITKDPIENDWSLKSTNSLIGGKAWDNTIDFNTSYIDNDLKTGATFYGMHRNRKNYDVNGDDFSEITKLRNTTFGTKAFYRPNENNKITLDLSVLDEFRRGGNAFDLAPHFSDVTEQLRTNSIIGGLTYDYYSKDWKHKLSIYGSGQKSNRESYYGGLGGKRTSVDSLRAANSYGNTKDIAYVFGSQYTYTLDKNTLTAGVEWNGNDTQDQIPGYYRSIDQQTQNLGSYIQYEWQLLAKLKTLIGARYDYSKIDGKYSLRGIDRSSKQNFGNFSPRLTVLYDIIPNLQFRGGYARGFRAPQAFNEDMHVASIGGEQVFVLIGEDLKTEYSDAYTGSLNFTRNIGNTQTSLLVEGFMTALHNPFTTVMTNENTEIIIEEMRNGEGAKVYGTNVELNIAPSKNISFQAGGTIQRSTYNQEQLLYEGDSIIENMYTKKYVRTPNVYGYFNTNYKPTEAFAIDLTGVYTGKMLVPHIPFGQSMIVKNVNDFVELNIRLGYTFKVKNEFNIEIFGGVQNMFNSYQKDFDTGAFRDSQYIYGPSKPRTFTFGIKLGHFH